MLFRCRRREGDGSRGHRKTRCSGLDHDTELKSNVESTWRRPTFSQTATPTTTSVVLLCVVFHFFGARQGLRVRRCPADLPSAPCTCPHVRCGTSKWMSSKKRSVSCLFRTKSIKMKELKRKWKQNFKVCRQGRKEEEATAPKGSIAAWKRWQSSWALWVSSFFARDAPLNV